MGRLYSLVQTGFHIFIMPLLVAFTRVLFICMFGKAIISLAQAGSQQPLYT